MRTPASLYAMLALVLLVFGPPGAPTAAANEGDRAGAAVTGALLGERFTITLEVSAPAGSTVDVDVLAPSWNGVDVIEIAAVEVASTGDLERHTITLVAAAFLPGDITVSPAVLLTTDSVVEQRQLPPFALSIPSTVPPDAPLELRGGPQPGPVGGAQSPLLIPLVLLAITGIAAAVLWVGWRLVTRIVRRTRRRPVLVDLPSGTSLLPSPRAVLDDPVPAYRSIAAIVRNAIGEQYGFPARALTTAEVGNRMQAEGVDRWQARLVTGLLENCDAVVYAGHRPSEVRRRADLTMAEEILEAFA